MVESVIKSSFLVMWVAVVAIGILGATSTPSHSTPDGLLISKSSIERVYDGDTFYININGIPDVFGKNVGVRILGIDTPEIRSRCKDPKQRAAETKLALNAKQSLSEKLNNAKVIELTQMQRDKYFRVLANVLVDGIDVAELLIGEGHARIYDGGKKEDWCERVSNARKHAI